MKNWHWIAMAVGIAALVIMKDKLPVGHPAPPAEIKLLSGRWDRVSSGDYIRFADNGWFRSQIDRKKQEGTFQLLPGSAIEFTVSYQGFDVFTNKPKTEKNVRECKCFIDGNRLFLDTNGHWIEFEKAKDASAKPEPAPIVHGTPAAK